MAEWIPFALRTDTGVPRQRCASSLLLHLHNYVVCPDASQVPYPFGTLQDNPETSGKGDSQIALAYSGFLFRVVIAARRFFPFPLTLTAVDANVTDMSEILRRKIGPLFSAFT